MKYSPTWIYEIRVSKQFAYVVRLGCFVVRDLCRTARRGNFANSLYL